MKNFKILIKKSKKATKHSIIGLCLLGALTTGKQTFAQTASYDKYVMEVGSSDGHGEYIRNLKHDGGDWGIAFSTGNDPKMMLSYDGNLKLGVSSGGIDQPGAEKSFTVEGFHSSQILSTSFTGAIQGGLFTNAFNILLPNSTAAPSYVGTKTNHNFAIATNNQQRMTFTTAGDIGIGTQTPESFSYGLNLHLNGDRRSRLIVESERYGQRGEVYMNSYADSDGDRGFYIGTTTNHMTYLKANNKKGLTVRYNATADDAFVGIGTTNPLEALHIDGNVRGNQTGGCTRFQTDYGSTTIGARNSNWSHFETDRSKFYFDKPVYVNTGLISSYNSNISFATTNASDTPDIRMTIDKTTGNVGIANNPHTASKLNVGGEIRATNFVSSATSFPDYVFEEDYEIMPLDKVETYVKEYKHLPNMPSEQEVITEGLNIPLIVDKSVENIETIYLHLIEMQKGMKQLENKIEMLEQENKKLKTALK